MRRWLAGSLACCALVVVGGCSGPPAEPRSDGLSSQPDMHADTAGQDASHRLGEAKPPDGSTTCPRLPGPADRPRKVVVAHPFKSSGQKVGAFEVLDLSATGKLAASGETFQLAAAATDGEILFTPDGKIGLVPLENGTLGVFRLDGAAQVVHAGYKPSFYVSRIVLDADGTRVLALSDQWRESGGGIYRLRINCDGTLAEEGLLTAAKLPAGLALLKSQGPSRAVLVAKDVLSSKPGDEVHLIDLMPAPALVAGANPFGDSEAIVSATALTPDERYLLIADANAFSKTAGNRVAAVELLTGKLGAAQVLADLKDPGAVIASPWGDTVLVLGVEADAITILD